MVHQPEQLVCLPTSQAVYIIEIAFAQFPLRAQLRYRPHTNAGFCEFDWYPLASLAVDIDHKRRLPNEYRS